MFPKIVPEPRASSQGFRLRHTTVLFGRHHWSLSSISTREEYVDLIGKQAVPPNVSSATMYGYDGAVRFQDQVNQSFLGTPLNGVNYAKS